MIPARSGVAPFAIGGRAIGPGRPVYVVAEMSGNHGGRLDRALRLVRAAAEAGADALKVQTYRPDTLTIDSSAPAFRLGAGTLWAGRTLHELYGEAATPWDWLPALAAAARDAGLDFFSTPFDDTAVQRLEELDVPAYKIASFELVDLALVRRVGRTGRPVILSTGMGTVREIAEAIDTAVGAGAAGVALLKCTSAYPAPPESMNLRTIEDMRRRFRRPVGLSDHSHGSAAAVAAVALGACIVEKHLTLDRALGGPDAEFSLEPREFAELVAAVRIAERALGTVAYGVTPSERASRVFRRSLFVVRDVRRGDRFTPENVRSIRPGDGLPPRVLERVLGRCAAADIERGTPLAWALVDGGEDERCES